MYLTRDACVSSPCNRRRPHRRPLSLSLLVVVIEVGSWLLSVLVNDAAAWLADGGPSAS